MGPSFHGTSAPNGAPVRAMSGLGAGDDLRGPKYHIHIIGGFQKPRFLGAFCSCGLFGPPLEGEWKLAGYVGDI